MKYRKKPVEIEAVKLEKTQHSIKKALEFMGQQVLLNCNTASDGFESYCKHCISDGWLLIDTLEGVMKASFSDYIIKGVQGEFYPCKPDIFHLTHDAV